MDNLTIFPNKGAIKEEAGVWIARLDSGDMCEKELQELRLWMQRSDFHREYLFKLAANWDAMGVLQELAEIFPLPEGEEADSAYEELKKASAQVPTVFAIFLDRPAILTNVRDKADVILANFGASDAAVLDVVLGRATARGRLPFELPSSMTAVEAQHPAIGDDSEDPLYPFGAGILPEN